MSPIRILVIAALLYLGYRLIVGGRKRSDRQSDGPGPGQSDGPVQDVLVEDPVCHSLVPKHQAVKLKHRGEMVYFCSEKCCDEFLADAGEE